MIVQRDIDAVMTCGAGKAYYVVHKRVQATRFNNSAKSSCHVHITLYYPDGCSRVLLLFLLLVTATTTAYFSVDHASADSANA